MDVYSSSTVEMDYALSAWIYGSCFENSSNMRAGGLAGLEGWIEGAQEVRP